jgi:RimJ/RimL family protein N-acetyltransferase
MIYGERIRLRAPEHADLPQFVAWLNDPEVRNFLLLYLPLSLAEEEGWFEEILKLPPPERPMVIEIHSGDEWKAIGDCGFSHIDWRCRSGELGIFIGEKSLWNQGYGTETMRLLLRHGFKTLNLNRIYLRVYETNPRGMRAYEKAGFVYEGRFRQAEYRDGQFIDVLFMSVLRSEWTE